MNNLNSDIIKFIKKNTEIKTVKTYDDFESFYHVVEDNTPNNKELRMIKRYLSNSKNANNILDIGSAGGRLAIPLIRDGHNLWCIDKSKYQCNRLKNKLRNYNIMAKIINGDIITYSFENNLFDICFMLNSVSLYFNSLLDMEKVLENVSKSLKKNGIFIFDIMVESNEKNISTFFNEYSDEDSDSLIIREITIEDNLNCNDCTIYTIRFKNNKYDIFKEFNRELKYDLNNIIRLIDKYELEVIDTINYDNFDQVESLERLKNIENIILVCKKR